VSRTTCSLRSQCLHSGERRQALKNRITNEVNLSVCKNLTSVIENRVRRARSAKYLKHVVNLNLNEPLLKKLI